MVGRHTQEMPQTYGGQEGTSENKGMDGKVDRDGRPETGGLGDAGELACRRQTERPGRGVKFLLSILVILDSTFRPGKGEYAELKD